MRPKYIALIAVAVVVAALSMAARRPERSDRAARLKAEYLYLQASQAQSEEAYDDYMLLLRRAHRLVPTDAEVAGQLASFDLAVGPGDSTQTNLAYRMLLSRFMADPTDYDTGSEMSSVALNFNKFDDAIMVWQKLREAYPERNDPAFNLACIYLTKYLRGDTSAFAPAIDIFNDLESKVGVNPQLTSYKIKAYKMRRDTTMILSEVQRLYAKAPESADMAVLAGTYFFDPLQMPDSALVYFDRAARLDSLNGFVYLTRAALFEQLGDSVAYDREVFRALASPTLDFDSKFQLLTKYVQSLYQDPTQQHRIENLFEVLENVNPGEARMHYLYGAYLAQLEKNERAAEEFGYAAELDPQDPDNWMALVAVCQTLEDYDKAAKYAYEAMKRFDKTLYFPLVLAHSYLRKKDGYLEGVELMKEFDVSHFNNPEAVSDFYASMGDLYYQAEQPDSAFICYNKALEYNPSNSMTLNNMAYYMSLTPGADLDQAERYASMALRADADNPTVLDTYAWILFKKKDFNGAKKYIDLTIREFGVTGSPSGWAEQLTEKVGDDRTLDDILEDMSATVLDHAGDIYFMNGDAKGALEFWEQAHALEPDNESIARKVKEKKLHFD